MTAHKFFKTLPMKLYILLAAIVLIAFFSNDFGLVDIQKTAIILAAGIDRSEAGFTLTAQIAVPKGGDRSQGGTSSVEVSAEGETVSDCVTQIFAKTGWVPKLVFCDLIVLGEEAAREDAVSLLDYFLRNEYMNDSCRLAVCEGTAEKLITSKSAIDDASALAIEKLFSDATEKSGRVMPNTLKDFAIGYYGVSGSSYLPYITTEPQDGAEGGGQGGQNGGSGQTGGGEAQQQVYSAQQTAIFDRGRMVAVLDPEETFALALLEGKVEAGTINAEDGARAVTLTVLKNEGGVRLDMSAAPKAELEVGVMVRLCCRGTTAPIEDISSDGVPEEILSSAERVLEEYIARLWAKAKESGCDLFLLRRSLYRSSLKKYAEWKDYLLKAVSPEISVGAKSMK